MHQPISLLFFSTVVSFWQAIGDPGQGWGNAILFVLMSRTVMKHLIVARGSEFTPCSTTITDYEPAPSISSSALIYNRKGRV